MLEIEWKSSLYHSNGRPRSRPKASTVHGWLVKWRATFSGNEPLRKEGIREMREAKAVREVKKQRRAARRAKAGASKSVCRLWPISLAKRGRQSQAPRLLPRAPQDRSSRRPSRGSTRRPTPPSYSPRPAPAHSRRPSHNRRETSDRHPRSSRKTLDDSQRDAIRAAEKRRRATAPT